MSIEKRVKRLEAQAGYPGEKPTGWTTVSSFSNGWAAGSTAPAYKKDSAGNIHMRGLLDPSSATGGIAFTLAAGVRPGVLMEFPAARNTGAARNAITGNVNSNGQVSFSGYSTSDSWVSLAGLVFPAEN